MAEPREVVAWCRLTLDGMIVLAETSFTLSDQVNQPPNQYFFRFPLGMGGLHFIDVNVRFSDRFPDV